MENFNPGDVAQKIMNRIRSEYKELKKLNVMILGKTGGKVLLSTICLDRRWLKQELGNQSPTRLESMRNRTSL